LIKQHHELGTTTVYVTHDQIEAMTMGDRICVMNQGEVAQIGRPTDIYRHPADLFVARFLGSPQMNLFQGTLTTENEDTILCQGPIRLNLGHRMSPSVAAHRGATVTAGVRPEDLYESPPPGFEHRIAPLAVRVVAVEPLGAETHLMLALATSGEELIARVGRETELRTGDQTTIFLDTSAIHLFDPLTTRTIV
jgi:ABC-type sugar transport system ATPase subunit